MVLVDGLAEAVEPLEKRHDMDKVAEHRDTARAVQKRAHDVAAHLARLQRIAADVEQA